MKQEVLLRRFVLFHLQWLSAQKMDGLLAQWALAFQEYEFTIQRGHENGNADALFRKYQDTHLPLRQLY